MCGIVGICYNNDAAVLAARKLHALQHRGQEAAGIVSREVAPDGTHFYEHRAPGLVGDVFAEGGAIGNLHGDAALGHVRYSTTGPKHTTHASQIADAQPLLRDGVALVHNGQLTNHHTLRAELERQGVRFDTSVDSEVILKLLIHNDAETLVARIRYALERIVGAYALIILSRKKLIGVRDPLGIRPLVFGRVGDGYAFASETCAFDIVKGEVIGEVAPGEMVVVENGDVSRHRYAPAPPPRQCIFEYIYFSRPDSDWSGENMFLVRSRLGKQLAREEIARDADLELFGDDTVVVPVLDSGLPAALGYAHQAHLRFSPALVRNHYAVGRSFIEPRQGMRDLKVLLKHNANQALVRDKRVVLVDDSVVRGTTSRLIVSLMRDAGAREVHLRIASAPITHECHHGIDTHTGDLLAAECVDVAEANERLRVASGADSAAYLSHANMVRAVRCTSQCDACFSGEYPTPLIDAVGME